MDTVPVLCVKKEIVKNVRILLGRNNVYKEIRIFATTIQPKIFA